MTQPLYSRDILRLAVSIPYQERLQVSESTVEKRSKSCGSVVVADVNLNNDNILSEMGWQINACALGQASAAILGAQAVGKSRDQIDIARAHLSSFLLGEADTPGHWDKIEMLASVQEHKGRHQAVLLPYDALIAAMDAALTNKKAA